MAVTSWDGSTPTSSWRLETQKRLKAGHLSSWIPNGNGEQDRWTEPGESMDPALDMRIPNGFYAVMPEPRGDAVWGSNAFRYPGSITRLLPGANPPQTSLAEVYTPPLPGFGIRGADIDKNGVVWTSLGSGHLGRVRIATSVRGR